MSPDHSISALNIREMETILNAIANEDAIKIFLRSKNGIKSSSFAIKELGLTQKRYYTRLKELITAGLILKKNNVYQLTTMGLVCYNLGTFFNRSIENLDLLDLADKLRSTKTIPLEESTKILRAISRNAFPSSIESHNLIQPVKIFETAEDLMVNLVKLIDNAEKTICLAWHHHDLRVVEAILRAIKRDIDLHLLTWEDGVSKKLQTIRMFMTPQITKRVLDLISREEVKMRHLDLPYSFCIIDEKQVLVELPSPLSKTFYLGFSLHNEMLSQKFMQTFDNLYRIGKEDTITDLIKKFKHTASPTNEVELNMPKFY